MKSILVIGLGRFGRHICKKLYELNQEVMAVDILERRVDAVMDYVTNAQIGDASNRYFVKSLGVSDFDICFVCIGDDFQHSLEVTSLLKEEGAPFVVSRAARDVHAKFLERNGADEVIYPERQIASWAAIRYISDHILDYIDLGKGYAVFEVEIPDKWIGKTVDQIDVRRKYNINIMGIKTGNTLNIRVLPETVLRSNMNLLVLGERDTIMKCFHL